MSRILHQRVLEGIDCVGVCAALEYQLGGDKPSESGLQFVLAKETDCTQQFIRELASDRGADLRDFPCGCPKSIETRRQRGVKRSWNRE
jgi:hypothetical protein